jgi:hypothetical protein
MGIADLQAVAALGLRIRIHVFQSVLKHNVAIWPSYASNDNAKKHHKLAIWPTYGVFDKQEVYLSSPENIFAV